MNDNNGGPYVIQEQGDLGLGLYEYDPKEVKTENENKKENQESQK